MGATVSTTGIRPALDQLAKLEIDAGPVLEAAGIAREAAEAVDARHPFANAFAVWDGAARAARDAWFGLHAALSLQDGWSLVDFIMSTSETLDVGYRRIAQYSAIVYDGSTSELLEEPESARFVRRAAHHGLQYDLFLVSFLVLRARVAAGVEWVPNGVKVATGRPDGSDELAAALRCEIEYNAPVMEIAIDRAVVTLPLVRANNRLNSVLRTYADELLARLPSRGSVIDRAHAEMLREMSRRLPTIAGVARAMHMSPRSLQRRLAERGTTFNDQLDEIRRGLALRYLRDASLSIGEIAFLLHFSEVSGFTRAFTRWMQQTPTEYRERLWREPAV